MPIPPSPAPGSREAADLMYLSATPMTCLQVPSSNDALGPPNQPVQPVPQNKKRQRAVEVSEACKSTLPPVPYSVLDTLRRSQLSQLRLGLALR